jgi:AraC-like DNA-binding protein/ligand-binding sensor protein
MISETKGSGTSGSPVISAMLRSKLYRDYREAFTKATGLPLELHAPDEMKVHRPTAAKAAPFCALMARTNVSCAACYALQRQLEDKAQLEPKTLKCFAGLCETAVPVRVGENLIAFLHTGHILVDHPDKAQFNRVAEELIRWGTHVDLKQAEEAYFATRVLSPRQYKSLIQLLIVFGEHLALCGNQLALHQNIEQVPAVRRAREIIDLKYQGKFSLGDIASLVNVSASYFSELFKKGTGMNFVEYVARVRVQKAKNMLANPNKRISEVAFDVGFQSLSQFNRAFKKFGGEAPTAYRARVKYAA